MTITITIEAHPDQGEMRGQIDRAMSALGFLRESAAAKRAVADLLSSTAPMVGEHHADYSELSSEELSVSDPDAEALIERSPIVVAAAPTRVPGQPSPGKQRRTKAEIAEDDALAAKQAAPRYFVHPESDDLIVTTDGSAPVSDGHVEEIDKEQYEKLKAAEKPLISTGEERIDPNHPEDSAEVQAADAADEAAETAATKTALTLDDVRRVVGLYVTKYGMQAAADPAAIIGCKMVEIPDTQEALADAVAKVEQATESNPFERAVVGAAPVAATIATATKADVNAALLRYAAKYDGTADQTKMPFTMEDGPRCLSMRFGDAVKKASDIPPDPASYAQAVADIEQMIEMNPFKRTAPVAA